LTSVFIFDILSKYEFYIQSGKSKTMAEVTIKDLESRIAIHEKQCEERWKTIFRRIERQEGSLDRIENILIAACGTIIIGGGSVIVTMVLMHN
tara:strand:+ start:769 stop:1047 length:279 start_codon:yes stop_codon:yes gene_type:complete